MLDSPDRVRLETDSGQYDIAAEAVKIGGDWLVYIWGGDSPHIGAVAAATPRPSLDDPAVTSATASVLAYVGHKEDDLAKMAAEQLASATGTRVVVTAGIHWDDISPGGIEAVINNSRDLIARLIERLK